MANDKIYAMLQTCYVFAIHHYIQKHCKNVVYLVTSQNISLLYRLLPNFSLT